MVFHSHLFNTDDRSPCFGEERSSGGEVLLELGVRLLLAAVAAAGGTSPGHFKRRSFVGAAAVVRVVRHDANNLTHSKKIKRHLELRLLLASVSLNCGR